ncbi:LOW QUALITY PROTEIN: extended synaptotagmin-3 [Sceloporus undulatus]|uniref:LOW QUALITY PROTEIN: extended synaptotagmin-3 n=1 Tax=Sceloporus undulatus TaxID=8520 RepID=UPI001C4CB67A|nr:LOW QUALITY PROTEIN: extended synaptotagmin-3 [Sceloporus undulatus]
MPPGPPRAEGSPGWAAKACLAPVLAALGSFVSRALLCLAPVYLAGYLGLSSSWLLLALLLWLWWRGNRRGKRARLQAAFGVHQREEQEEAIRKGLASHQLPAWVHFPDVERVEWLNKILEQSWPYFGAIMEKTFKEVLEPKIRAKNVHLRTCTFTKVNFGDKCPKIKGVKAYTKEVDRRQVMLDLQICYIGDCEIHMELSKFKVGVKGVQLYGTLRVILEPLLTDAPFVGAVTIFFIQKPHLEINWAGLTNLLDAPGISVLSDSLIQDLISSRLVLPNRITIPLKKNINVANLRFPIPRGVVRVYLLEAENLVQKDNFLGAIRGKSDPYALLRVGLVQYRSKTIQRNLNPIWNEMFEFVVHELPGQDLEIDLYDEDPDKDDFLGSLLINLADVMKDRVVDEWFPLSKIASGHVHLKLKWFSLVTSQEKLYEDKNGLATAILIVYLDSAFNLPKNQYEYSNGEYGAKKYRKDRYLKKMEREPSSFVLLTVGNKTHRSKTCTFTKDPAWGQAFTFFVHSAASQSLHLEIKDKDRENALGTLVLSLAHLLKNPEMTIEQNFQLDHSGVDSCIKLKVVLRALDIEKPDPESTYTGTNAFKNVPIPVTEQDGNQDNAQLLPPPPPPQPPLPKVEVPKAPDEDKDGGMPKSTGDTQVNNANLNVNEKLEEPIVVEAVSGINEQAGPGGVDSKFLTLPKKAAMLPALRRLQLAPSLASMGSLGSSNFDVTCSNLDLSNGMPMGEIHLTVRYASLRQSLIVLVNACRNLTPCSRQGAHPYVRIYLLPDKRWVNRRRTTVKKKTLNPHYDEKFEFFDTVEDIKKRTLDVAVKNRKPFISHERKELGKVLIDLSKEDLLRGFSQWYQLTINGQPCS